MAEQATREKINRLYWGSDDSVGIIAERLGISRRTLYDSIDPRPAGADCPRCGSPLGFRNRTTAERGEAECAGCGLEQSLDQAAEQGAEQGPADAGGRDAGPSPADLEEPEVEQERVAGRLSPVRAVPGRGSGPALGGAMLAGLVVGAAAGYLMRRG